MTPNRTHSAALTSTQIERFYVQEIQSGRIAPGSKMPSNQELAQQWETSCSTVQKALLNLVAMGLVDRAPRRGTFVREKTERALVGILLGPSLTETTASHYRVLATAIARELNTDFLSCRTYDNLATDDAQERDAILHHLSIDQTHHVFRGFVHIVSLPHGISIDDIVPPLIPKVVCDQGRTDNDFVFDYKGFIRESALALKEQGCRRIIVIVPGNPNFEYENIIHQLSQEQEGSGEPFISLLAVKNCRNGHFIEVDTDSFLGGYIENTPPSALPDGIIFTDDISARGGVFAMLKRGIRIPEQIRVATLVNEGAPIHYSVPVTRYEYPAIVEGKQIAELLMKRMAGGTEPNVLPVVMRGRLLGD